MKFSPSQNHWHVRSPLQKSSSVNSRRLPTGPDSAQVLHRNSQDTRSFRILRSRNDKDPWPHNSFRKRQPATTLADSLPECLEKQKRQHVASPRPICLEKDAQESGHSGIPVSRQGRGTPARSLLCLPVESSSAATVPPAE